MTWLRHAPRHIHASVADYAQAQLTALNWLTAGSVPFGAAQVSIVRTPAISADGKLLDGIGPGYVAITLGSETPPVEEEMGGPLSTQPYPIFIDVFQDSHASAVALASDLRDIFLGRLPGAQRWLAVTNQITGAEEPGWHLSFEDVERVHPESSLPLHWQIVKVTAVATFAEVVV